MSLRNRLVALACAAGLVAATGAQNATALSLTSDSPDLPNGISEILADGTLDGVALATFDARPTADQISALRGLGLRVQHTKSLPIAYVAGEVSAMREAVVDGIVDDVYPNETYQYFDTDSSNAMSSSVEAAEALRAKGFTGKGVKVGIVDSGCDATHPDLANRVVNNVILYSPEYANAGTDPIVPVPVDAGPYNNTDLGSGHGTHVAGIVAADSSSVSDGSRLGVAPDAHLACFAIGAVIATTAVVSAYDYMLSQPDQMGIKVVNNSWGNSYRQYDPNDPIAIATKAIAKKGVTVVFAAGNAGSEEVSASLNPFSQYPWVISVAAGTLDRHRSGFSSNGLVYDNSQPVEIGSDGHTSFTGDRIGLVHPDVTAPGSNISSSCDTTGTVVGPCPEGGANTSASGTSMASPHIAGAAAVLLQAQPKLTPTQVRLALQASATPVMSSGDSPTALPFWQVGYGYVNLDKAVKLVRGAHWKRHLARASHRADRRVRNADGTTVVKADFWQYDAPPASVYVTDYAEYSTDLAKGVKQLAVTLVHPSLGAVGINGYSYEVTVYDPSGNELGTSTESFTSGSGTATITVDVTEPGTYSFEIWGNYAISDPDTIDSDSIDGRVILLHVAQIRKS